MASSDIDYSEAARRWADDRTEKFTQPGGKSAEYKRIDQAFLGLPRDAALPATSFHVNLSLHFDDETAAALARVGREIAGRIDDPRVIPLAQKDLHMTLTWSLDWTMVPRTHAHQTPAGAAADQAQWSRRNLRALGERVGEALKDVEPLQLHFSDLAILPKQVFAVPDGNGWPPFFDLAERARTVEGMGAGGYDRTKSPLDGGAILQTTLMLFKDGIPMEKVGHAVAPFRHGGALELDVPTVVDKVKLIIHEHRQLSTEQPNPGTKAEGPAFTGVRQLGRPLAMIDLANHSFAVDGSRAKLAQSFGPDH